MRQIDLARLVCIRSETVCRLEKQRQAAGLDLILTIAGKLRVAPDCLTGGIDPVEFARRVERQQHHQTGQLQRRCTDCGLFKPRSAFTPIKQSRIGVYGRCRVCRALRARERRRTLHGYEDPSKRALVDIAWCNTVDPA